MATSSRLLSYSWLADVKERWIAWGANPNYSKSPEEFAALLRSEAAKWATLVGQGSIKLE